MLLTFSKPISGQDNPASYNYTQYSILKFNKPQVQFICQCKLNSDWKSL